MDGRTQHLYDQIQACLDDKSPESLRTFSDLTDQAFNCMNEEELEQVRMLIDEKCKQAK